VRRSTAAAALGLYFAIAHSAQAPAAQRAGAPAPVAAPGSGSSSAVTPRFDVHEYRVLGNTVLTNRQIEGVLYPRLGDGKTFADVEAARTALETAYHAFGYQTVFVDIPPQEVTDGIVRLHVTEGRVRVRTIHGARYFSEGKLLAELPATQPGTVPNIPQLQQQLNAVNAQSADRSVVPILKAGPEPGTMDLALNVNDHLPLHGSLEIDNQYTPDTKALRATAALSYDNLFADLDTIGAQYTTSPQDTREVGVLNFNYGFAPLADGLRPSASFTNSSSNVATVGTLGVLGDGQIYSARLALPLMTLPSLAQTLTLGIDYKHFRNTIDLAGVPTESTTGLTSTPAKEIEPIAYTDLSLTYAGAWRRLAPSGSPLQSLTFDVSANAGPRGVTDDTEEFDNSRFEARGNYAYFRTDVAFTTLLPEDLQLILRASGQGALEPLVVYEQESFTGAAGVRGYLEAEVLGDTGVKGTLQLQSPSISLRGFLLGDSFVFFDAGHAHYIDALPGEPGHTILRSYGAGLDLLPGHVVTGTLTWAVPLTPGPDTRAHVSRILFDVKGAF
jgi:hemolysin activation/secretion protein